MIVAGKARAICSCNILVSILKQTPARCVSGIGNLRGRDTNTCGRSTVALCSLTWKRAFSAVIQGMDSPAQRRLRVTRLNLIALSGAIFVHCFLPFRVASWRRTARGMYDFDSRLRSSRQSFCCFSVMAFCRLVEIRRNSNRASKFYREYPRCPPQREKSME